MANVAIIGYADHGQALEPVLLANEQEIWHHLYRGTLAEAALLALRAGASGVIARPIPYCREPHELFCQLDEAYTSLEAARFDVLVPMPVFYGRFSGCRYTYGMLHSIQASVTSRLSQRLHDLSIHNRGDVALPFHDPFIWQLLEFLVTYAAHGELAHAAISVDLDTIGDDIVRWIVANRPDFSTIVAGKPVDLGDHLSIVVGSVLYTSAEQELFSALATPSYAGLLASLPHSITPTNKLINGVSSVSPTLYDFDASRITASGCVALINSVRQGIVPFSAVTAAQASSPGFHVINPRLTSAIRRSLVDSLRLYMRKRNIRAHKDVLIEEAVTRAMEPYMIEEAIYQYDYDYHIRAARLHLYMDVKRHGELQGLRIHISESVM